MSFRISVFMDVNLEYEFFSVFRILVTLKSD